MYQQDIRGNIHELSVLAEELTTAQTNEYLHVVMQLANALFTELSAEQRTILRDEFLGK